VFLVVVIPLGYYLFFFAVKANFREVVPQKVYRSAQPSPAQLKKWTRRYGIKTVINLRGYTRKITDDEETATNELGIKMVTIRFKSSSLPTRNSLDKLIQTLETAEQPILMHCRDGVERAGMASTLAAMAIGKENYDTAKWQAYVPPGPWKRKRNDSYVHISDMFKLYERYRQSNKPDINDWQEFKQWSTVTDAFAEIDTKYRRNYCYFSQFNKTEWLYPIAKLTRDAWAQFAVELVLVTLAGFAMYRKLLKKN
jgi:protein tyrosine phosphatase (PTP) superfamily phosphohydrolase (DUF442 family)